MLLNIINHCKRINEKTSNISKEDFLNDEDTVEIVCFNIIQIGELAKRLPSDFINKYCGVAWQQIKGMRDKVAHGYGTIDKIKIWDTARDDINTLLDYCQTIINQ